MTPQRRNIRQVHVDGAPSRPPRPGAQPPRPARATTPPAATPPSSTNAAGPAAAAAQRDRVERNEAELEKRVQSLVNRLARLTSGLPALAGRLTDESKTALEQTRNSSAANLKRLREQAQKAFEEEDVATARTLTQCIDTLAPGSASRAWRDWKPDDTPGLPSPTVRIGTIDLGQGVPLAALVPLIDTPGWFVDGTGPACVDAARSAILRIASETPTHLLSINVFDPRLTGAFGQFSGLRKIRSTTFPPPRNDPASFREVVDHCIETAGRNAELVVSSSASTLTQLWQARPNPEGIQQILVVLDYPFGVDEELQRRLVHAASVAGPNGLSLVVAADPTVTPAEHVDPAALRTPLRTFDVTAGQTMVQAVVEGLPGSVEIDLDPPPTDEIARDVIALAAERAEDSTGPVVRLSELIGVDIAQPWTHSSAASLDVPIGTSAGETLELSIRTENPPFPNMLIGGAVGQGKSNLLLTFIYGIAARYSPDDVALYLLDFKQGLEFKRFDADASGENWLPHARVLGLESNNAFGLAVLQYIFDAMEKRASAFKRVGANSIDAYRQETGKPLPRLVVVIDEFQVMFDGELDEVEPQINLLEQIAKLGRAYGIHLVLASQAMTGIRALAMKSSSIFSQFPLRVSLKNTPEESQAFLSTGNKAASELTFRGEAVVNRNFGGNPDHDNERALVAWAEPDTVEALQQSLWQRDRRERPLVFVGGAAATWEPEMFELLTVVGSDNGLRTWIGRPIGVTDEPRFRTLTKDADQGIAVIGSDQTIARMALHTMIVTALPGLNNGCLTIVDGADEAAKPWFVDVARRAAEFGVEVRVVDRLDGATYLRDEVDSRLDGDGPTELIVVPGVQRIPGMEDEGEGADEPDDDGYINLDDPRTARSVLGDIARRGAVNGVFFIGWWNNLRSAETDLGPDLAGAAAVISVGLSHADLRMIGGVAVPPITEQPRLGYFDRAKDGVEVLVPYAMFVDDTADESPEEDLV